MLPPPAMATGRCRVMATGRWGVSVAAAGDCPCLPACTVSLQPLPLKLSFGWSANLSPACGRTNGKQN